MNQELYDTLLPQALEAFTESAKLHCDHKFYSIGLFTSRDFGYVCDSVCTEEGLRKVAQRYLEDEYYKAEYGDKETAMLDLRWSVPDSPYHVEFADRFETSNELLVRIWQASSECDVIDEDEGNQGALKMCQEIHETFVAVLADIRAEGIFPDDVIFNVLKGDQSHEEMYANAEQINDGQLLSRFLAELEICAPLDSADLVRARLIPWEM